MKSKIPVTREWKKVKKTVDPEDPVKVPDTKTTKSRKRKIEDEIEVAEEKEIEVKPTSKRGLGKTVSNIDAEPSPAKKAKKVKDSKEDQEVKAATPKQKTSKQSR